MPVTERPPELRLSMPQGGNFHRELEPAEDRASVEAGTPAPFDWTGWTARVDFVNEQDVVVTSFATSGEDGVITMYANGGIDFDMDTDLIDALAATVEVAGVIHAPLYGNFVVTSPDDDDYVAARAVLEITRRTGP